MHQFVAFKIRTIRRISYSHSLPRLMPVCPNAQARRFPHANSRNRHAPPSSSPPFWRRLFRFWRPRARHVSRWPELPSELAERRLGYQYFPNKAAILFRLQSDEWRQTSDMLREILEDSRQPPFERLRSLVRAFIQSECDEAQIRVALNDAAPLYRDAPEHQAARMSVQQSVDAFMLQALPAVPAQARALAGDLVITTLSTVGKRFSSAPRSPVEVAVYSDAMADMFCAYLESLQRQPPETTLS